MRKLQCKKQSYKSFQVTQLKVQCLAHIVHPHLLRPSNKPPPDNPYSNDAPNNDPTRLQYLHLTRVLRHSRKAARGILNAVGHAGEYIVLSYCISVGYRVQQAHGSLGIAKGRNGRTLLSISDWSCAWPYMFMVTSRRAVTLPESSSRRELFCLQKRSVSKIMIAHDRELGLPFALVCFRHVVLVYCEL